MVDFNGIATVLSRFIKNKNFYQLIFLNFAFKYWFSVLNLLVQGTMLHTYAIFIDTFYILTELK